MTDFTLYNEFHTELHRETVKTWLFTIKVIVDKGLVKFL